MPSHEPTTVAPSLDGRRFVMESSTNSEVNPDAPSRFRYSERDGVIWGDYDGDTVTFGQFVGTRVDNRLTVPFDHVMAAPHDDARASWTDDVPEALERTPA